jgi:ribosomal protein S4
MKVRNQFGFSFRIDIGTPKRLRKKITNYTRRLKSRHILRLFSGGAMNVRQFRSYLKKTRKQSSLILYFFKLFETRLDTLVYRFNFFDSPGQIRQSINHANFLINGKLVIFAGQHIDYFDVLSVRLKKMFFNKLIHRFKTHKVLFSIPFFIEINFRIMCLTIYCNPSPKKIFYPTKIPGALMASVGPRFSSF